MIILNSGSEFFSSPIVRTQHFLQRGPGPSRLGAKILQTVGYSQKIYINKKEKISVGSTV